MATNIPYNKYHSIVLLTRTNKKMHGGMGARTHIFVGSVTGPQAKTRLRASGLASGRHGTVDRAHTHPESSVNHSC